MRATPLWVLTTTLFLFASTLEAVGDLAHMSLEELMEIEVSLAARKSRPLSESAAAVAVITSDDLRRSGVRSLPEALRLVPCLQVGVVDDNAGPPESEASKAASGICRSRKYSEPSSPGAAPISIWTTRRRRKSHT
jgi:hypothetical protein